MSAGQRRSLLTKEVPYVKALIAGRETSYTNLYKSYDGLNFTSANPIGPSGDTYIDLLEWVPLGFWIAGSLSTNSGFWTSPDGLIWTYREPTSFGRQLRAVTWNSSYCFITDGNGRLYRSSDGATWTSISSPFGSGSGDYACNALTVNASGYLLMGGGTNAISTSNKLAVANDTAASSFTALTAPAPGGSYKCAGLGADLTGNHLVYRQSSGACAWTSLSSPGSWTTTNSSSSSERFEFAYKPGTSKAMSSGGRTSSTQWLYTTTSTNHNLDSISSQLAPIAWSPHRNKWVTVYNFYNSGYYQTEWISWSEPNQNYSSDGSSYLYHGGSFQAYALAVRP